MAVPPERMKTMRDRRRAQDFRIVMPDPRLATVRVRVAKQVARLDPRHEADALGWIEAVSEFGAPDASAGDGAA